VSGADMSSPFFSPSARNRVEAARASP